MILYIENQEEAAVRNFFEKAISSSDVLEKITVDKSVSYKA